VQLDAERGRLLVPDVGHGRDQTCAPWTLQLASAVHRSRNRDPRLDRLVAVASVGAQRDRAVPRAVRAPDTAWLAVERRYGSRRTHGGPDRGVPDREDVMRLLVVLVALSAFGCNNTRTWRQDANPV